MFEEFFESAESNMKHKVFVENSPFDPAGNIVLKDCPQCGLNFLTMIRIGVNENVIFSCSCGYLASNAEYIKTGSQKGSSTKESTQKK